MVPSTNPAVVVEPHKGDMVRFVEALIGCACKQHTRLTLLHVLLPSLPEQERQAIANVNYRFTPLTTWHPCAKLKHH